MRTLLVGALLLVATPAAAERAWTGVDTGLEATFAAILLADYVQTRKITADGEEGNPIMGAHGERIPPAMYFASAACLHALTAVALPQPWRRIAQGVTIGVAASSVRRNWQAGYGLEF